MTEVELDVPAIIEAEIPALEVTLATIVEDPVIIETPVVIIETPVVIIETPVVVEMPVVNIETPALAKASKIPKPMASKIAVPVSRIAVPVSRTVVPVVNANKVSVPVVASKKDAKVSVPVEVEKIEKKIKLETPRKALSAMSAPPQAKGTAKPKTTVIRAKKTTTSTKPKAKPEPEVVLPKKLPISLTNRVSLIKRRPVLHPEPWMTGEWF